MGQAKQKRTQIEANFDGMAAAARDAGHAIRRLAKAASGHYGQDCYLHAALGQILLADRGYNANIDVGFAAWRIGSGDGDVISHTTAEQGYLPAGAHGFPYHAWLTWNGCVIDLTTYQLRDKAADLDAADGGTTQVDWCPDLLILRPTDLKAYRQVAQAPDAGVVYYESKPELMSILDSQSSLDAQDVMNARLLMSNPDTVVMGPNDIKIKL